MLIIKKTEEVVWYENLIKRVLAGELTVSVHEGNEGPHDCLDVKVEGVDPVSMNGLCYEPVFVMFYDSLADASVESGTDLTISCKSSGEFKYIFTYTENGFGEGVYLDETTHPELFKKVCQVAKQQLVKQASLSTAKTSTDTLSAVKPQPETTVQELVTSGQFLLSTGEMTRLEVVETSTHNIFKVWLGDKLISLVKHPVQALKA